MRQIFRGFHGRFSGDSMADFQGIPWQIFRGFHGRFSGDSMGYFPGIFSGQPFIAAFNPGLHLQMKMRSILRIPLFSRPAPFEFRSLCRGNLPAIITSVSIGSGTASHALPGCPAPVPPFVMPRCKGFPAFVAPIAVSSGVTVLALSCRRALGSATGL